MRFYSIIAAAAFIIAGCNSKPNPMKALQAGAKPDVKVQAYRVQPRELAENITVSGTLIPNEETDLHPEISGKIVGLFIQEGSQVQKGTLLCKLFDGDLVAQRKKLEVQLATARKTEQRQKELLSLNGSSAQEADLATLQVQTLEADIELLQVQIAKTEIRAPFSGKIGLKTVSIGAYITPAMSIARIQQIQPLKLDFSLPEKYISAVRTGDIVQCSVEGSPKQYQARILATEAGINQETRNIKVRAQVIDPSAELTAGAFAKVQLTLGQQSAALMVPTKVIIPQARDKKVIVIKNGIAYFETVTTGIRTQDMVEIISGISEGDTIAVSGIMFIKPQAKVKISTVVSSL